MAVYTVAVRTPAAGAGAAYAVIRAAAADRVRVREIAVFTSAATASSVGLIRTTANGTITTSTLVQAQEPADPAGTCNIDTVWSVAPTIGTIYLRRIALPATASAGIIFTWPSDAPLIVPVSGGIALWNFGGLAGSALDAHILIDE